MYACSKMYGYTYIYVAMRGATCRASHIHICFGLRIDTLDGGGIHGARARLELRRGGGAPRHDDERVAVRGGG